MDNLVFPAAYHAAPDLLSNRVILITGSGQGLGKAAALACAKHGGSVVLHGRSVQKLEQTYDEIVAAGFPPATIFPLDLANATDKDFEQMARALGQEFGRLDGLLHCAAMLNSLRPLALEPLDDWLKLLRVNLAAPFALTRACLPLLHKSENASVVFTSESHGVQPSAYWGGFAVSKYALQALLAIWSAELSATENLRMNLVVPGPMASPQRAVTHPGEDKTPLKTPDVVVPVLLYLLGSDSKTVSGQILNLDHP
ncbi:MAG: SDR family NAD(P)-dependent oxidoreductase [Burkholderiales bacterium]